MSQTSAGAQTFRDDFNGSSVNGSVWGVASGSGQVYVGNGEITLVGGGATFPAVITKHDPFPAGDYVVRVGLRYDSVAWCGCGVGSVDNFYPFFPQGCRPFLAWQDSQGWYVYSGGTDYRYLGTGPETGYHEYEWRYVDGTHTFFLDGVSLRSESCAPRATAIFLGHLHPVSCSPWTSFSVDYVEVSPHAVTPTTRERWGRLKQIYR
jgi:hypothetical protein